jgi:transposase
MRSERTAPKNREPTVGISLTTILQHIGLILVKDFLAKKNVTIMGHSPYSPDLATAEFYLFTQLKPVLKARGFCDATDIIKNATEELKRL